MDRYRALLKKISLIEIVPTLCSFDISVFFGLTFIENTIKSSILDFFPNWQNTLQMTGHALLSTNFNTIQSHLQS